MSDNQHGFSQPYRPYRRNNNTGKQRKFYRGNQGHNNHNQECYNNTAQGPANPGNFQAQNRGRGRGYAQGRGQPPYWRGFPRGRGRGLHWPQPQPQYHCAPEGFPSQLNTAFPGVPNNFQSQPVFLGTPPVNPQTQTHVISETPENFQYQAHPTQAPDSNSESQKRLDYTPGFLVAPGNSHAQSNSNPAPNRQRLSRWDMMTDICRDKDAGKASKQGCGSSQVGKAKSESFPKKARTLMSKTFCFIPPSLFPFVL